MVNREDVQPDDGMVGSGGVDVSSAGPQAGAGGAKRGSARFGDGFRFLARFVRHPTSVGAVLPSSKALARALVGDLSGLSTEDSVVEFGPGTGPMTAACQAVLPAGVRYLGIELDPKFHATLVARFPDLEFCLGSAGDVVQILEERGIAKPLRILSGLPFASLPPVVQDSVVAGIVGCLKEGGEFRTFQYAHAFKMKSAKRFRARMAEHFSQFERSPIVLGNVPPAYVLSFRR